MQSDIERDGFEYITANKQILDKQIFPLIKNLSKCNPPFSKIPSPQSKSSTSEAKNYVTLNDAEIGMQTQSDFINDAVLQRARQIIKQSVDSNIRVKRLDDQILQENATKQFQEIKKTYESNYLEWEKLWQKCNSSLTNIANLQKEHQPREQTEQAEIGTLLKCISEFKSKQETMKLSELQLIENLEKRTIHLQELKESDQQQKEEIIKLSGLILQMHSQLENLKQSDKGCPNNATLKIDEVDTDIYSMVDDLDLQLTTLKENSRQVEPNTSKREASKIKFSEKELTEARSKLTNYENLVMCIKKNLRQTNENKTIWIDWISADLINAAENGQIEFIRFLAYLGADINAKREDGATALSAALVNGHVDVINQLLNYGANIDCTDEDGHTTLHWAAEKGHLDLVIKLISQGADVNHKSKTKCTPLHCSTVSGYLDITNELISHGADINGNTEDNMTPLHFSVVGGYLNIVKELLSHGVDINCINKNHETPLHLAADKGHLHIVNQLISQGADVNLKCKGNITPLHRSAANGNIHALNELIWNGAAVNCKTVDDMTPLHYAVQYGHLDLVLALLKHGADIDAKDKKGNTPLEFAVKFPKVVDVLKKHAITS